MTCALWSVRRGGAQYELCRDEAEARGNLYFEADLLVLRGRLAIWDGDHRVHTLASIVRLATGLVDQPGPVELSMSLQSRAHRRNAA